MDYGIDRLDDIENFGRRNRTKFDLIYLRLVLQHVGHPERTVRLLYQLLKNGGTLIVEDGDRELMVFHPSSILWEKCYKQAIQFHRDHGGDPFIGRKISSFLENVKFFKY